MKIFNHYILGIIALFIISLSCDDRIASETEADSYTIDLTGVSVSNGKLVGEDIAGATAFTSVTAVVTTVDDKPAKDVLLTFKSIVSGESYGTFDIPSIRTDDDGIATVLFTDGGSGAVDDLTTAIYEGVKVTASYDDNSKGSVKFDVYNDLADVWPYKLYLSSNVAQINLDNGITKASLEARLINKLNRPLPNVAIEFSSNKGFIESDGTTDANGKIIKEFTDLGVPSDIGLANIVATFDYPSANEISDSVQIAIITQYNLDVKTYPMAFIGESLTRVGEDVAGDGAFTMIVATVTDTGGNPISGVDLEFSATWMGSDIGEISVANANSNSAGEVIAYFSDLDVVYRDVDGTPNFEGVLLTASYGDDTIENAGFNVYSSSDVWPYSLVINTNTDEILVDNGETQAEITVRLLNQLGLPVENVVIAYNANHGFIYPTGVTDSTGVDTVYFTDLGDPDDIGVTSIEASFVHPGFAQSIDNSVQVMIRDDSFSECAYIEIPSSNPGHIVVKDGGGLESTFIKAEVYDYDGNLIDTPTPVTFLLEPPLAGALLDETGIEVTTYTVNGIATVTINSGTRPGVVRVVVTVDCDDDPETPNLTSIAEPVIIASGAPKYMEAVWDPGGTDPDNGGGYVTQVEALVWDVWYNQVEDSTYVYWTILPVSPDTNIVAFVEGVSLTYNENWGGEQFTGHAFSTVHFAPEAIGDLGTVTAITYGVNGDTISAQINGEENAQMYFLPGQVLLTTDITYYDFTLQGGTSVLVTATVFVVDYYGNAVKEVPISFAGMGVASWVEVAGYPIYTLFGPTVDTDQDGVARISAVFSRGLCILQNTDDSVDPPICTYDDFTGSITATIMIPEITSSDPAEIQLVRTPDNCN